MWNTTNLDNESDVEQKFIYPFLTENLPLGLGFPSEVVQTKKNIRRLPIGKGSDKKVYFPDYIIVTMGYPIMVLEAKSPNESVEEGYREARLYAMELNSLFGHGSSPAKFVIATNGVDLWYGYSDVLDPIDKVACSTLGIYSSAIADIIEKMSWTNVQKTAEEIAKQYRSDSYFKPRHLVGGAGIQNEEVAINSFGATLTAQISPVFNPTSKFERAKVARNAYISSKRRERYVDPIDRVIRAAKPPSETQAIELEDSAKPKEILQRLNELRSLEHRVLLLVGSVGSGKSTFIDHLIEVALPNDLIDATVWCRINMNAAPVSADEIYKWLRREIIEGCKQSLPDLDFDALITLRKLFGIEIHKFNKGTGEIYKADEKTYNIKLAEFLDDLQKDQDKVTNAFVRFCCAERGKLLIVVLDNCDKKSRDEQLLMFEAAQWLQNEYRCLVILPLRDETYDNHRNQPPLDTALKDLVFRIEPPLFYQVLMKRVQYVFRELLADGEDRLSFNLPNGYHVDYPKSDQAYYLTSILKSLFEHDRFVRRMIVGLSGRNMRRALEIFLEVCSSGHIGEDQIFKIRQSQGNYSLPLYQVATVLIRMNRRFYDSDHSYVKNVFAGNVDDTLPAFFSRYMILQWLRSKFRSSGTSGYRGYFPKQDIKRELIPYGLAPDMLDREFNYLLGAQCIVAEHLRLDSLQDEDLVRLGPAGFVHLDLISNVNYLAAVAEDTLFPDRIQAEEIANRIKNLGTHLHLATINSNAADLVQYLDSIRSAILPKKGSYIENNFIEKLTSLEPAKEALLRIAKSKANDPWFDADKQFKRGSIHRGIIQNTTDFGYFIELENGLVGLVHVSKLNNLSASTADSVEVEILWVDLIQKKIGLKLVAVLEEDVGDYVEGAHSDPQRSLDL